MAKRVKEGAGAAAVRAVFEIEEGQCVLGHKSERLEKHGNEDVLAGDLQFEFKTDNGILACFAPSLKSALYEKAGAQGELVEDVDHMTHLRFPGMGVIKWTGADLEGASVTVHAATGKKGEIVLSGCKVNKLRLEPQEGGTVIVRFRVQVSPLDEGVSGKLSKVYANKICTLSVTPPQPSDEVQKDLQEEENRSRLH